MQPVLTVSEILGFNLFIHINCVVKKYIFLNAIYSQKEQYKIITQNKSFFLETTTNFVYGPAFLELFTQFYFLYFFLNN